MLLARLAEAMEGNKDILDCYKRCSFDVLRSEADYEAADRGRANWWSEKWRQILHDARFHIRRRKRRILVSFQLSRRL